MARDAGLSKHHFSRQFKRMAGLGFSKARLQARLAKARRLLLESPLGVEAVAYECGFKNAAHFSKAFKQEAGSSPSEYRSKHDSEKNKVV
jgi:transcriptional regulator GlxA family with amidase domain